MNTYPMKLTIACLLSAASLTAPAAVIYESTPYAGWTVLNGQGPINAANSYSLSSRFTLNNSATLSSALLGLITSTGGTPMTVNWRITTDFFSGTTLASGTAPLASTLTRNYGLYWYDSSFDFSTPLDLPAGSYCFELSEGTSTYNSPIYWGTTGFTGLTFEQQYHSTGTINTFADATTPFQLLGELSAVPEPSEWAAMSFGLLGIVWVVKRRFMPARSYPRSA